MNITDIARTLDKAASAIAAQDARRNLVLRALEK